MTSSTAPTLRLTFAVSVAGLLSLVFLTPEARASCLPPAPMKQTIEKAPIVFVGTVLETSDGGRTAVVRVEEVWKGEVGDRVSVRGGMGGGAATSVDRFYWADTRYLFVPYDLKNGVAQDNACTRTTRYRPALDRFAPDEGGSRVLGVEEPELPSPGVAPLTMVVVGAVLAAASALLLLRRLSRPH